MQGDPKLLEMLNGLLAGELTAIDQYFVHSRMYEDWGLQKLYERIEHEREDEVGHADRLIKRIHFLGGTPDLATREPLNIGKDVEAMLRSDLELEYAVVKTLKDTIAYAEQIGDYVTRSMLVELLDDTEQDHAHWLEQQLGLIKRLGLQNYQQSQL